MKIYQVVDEGRILQGNADEVLSSIKNKTSIIESDITHMSLAEYIQALIDNVNLFLPETIVSKMDRSTYDTDSDWALSLLSAMPASNARIVSIVEEEQLAA